MTETLSSPRVAPTPGGSVPQLLPGEQIALRDESRRIKAALYAEYGPQIQGMLDQLGVGAQPPSYLELRAKRIEEMLSHQTPLRKQVRSCQNDAMARLIEAAHADAARGEDVSTRLAVLLKLQSDLETQRETEAASLPSSPAKAEAEK